MLSDQISEFDQSRILPADRCTYQTRKGQQCPHKAFYKERCRKHGGMDMYLAAEKDAYILARAEYSGDLIPMSLNNLYDLHTQIVRIDAVLDEIVKSFQGQSIEKIVMRTPNLTSLIDLRRRLVSDSIKNEKLTGNLWSAAFCGELFETLKELITEAALEQGVDIAFMSVAAERFDKHLAEKQQAQKDLEQDSD
jgi:hypothetical protein